MWGVLLFGPILFASSSAHGEDLVSIFKMALDRDPRFQGSEYRYQASREIMKQAYSELLFTLSADGEYIKTNQDIKSSDNAVFATGETDYDTKTYTITLTQPVFRYASWVRLGQARAETKRSDLELEAARHDLLIRVAERYFGALAALDQLSFVQAEEAAVQRHFELAQARHSMGLAPITDRLDAKARLASVIARRIEAENSLDDALQALQEVVGERVKEVVPLKEDLPLNHPNPDDLAQWTGSAMKQNIALEIQRQTVEAAKKEISRQGAGHWPYLDLVARMNNRDTDGTLFGGGSEVETQEYLLRLTVPLVQGGYVYSKTKEARELFQASQKDLEREERAVERGTRAAFLGVKTAISKTDSLKQSVTAQELTLQAKQEGFKSGLYTSLDVLDAERDLHFAKQGYAQARYDYVVNSLRLKQAVGTLSDKDMEMVNQWLK